MGGEKWDFCSSVAIDSLNNIYISGGTNSYGAGSGDICLLKYDNSGLLLWNRTWGSEGGESSYDMVLDSSDNIFLIDLDIGTMVKFNPDGQFILNVSWDYTIAGGGIDIDSLDNIYIAGSRSSDMYLLNYDNSSIFQWNRTWGTYPDPYNRYREHCNAITIDSSDNIYLAGYKTTKYTWRDMCIIKISKESLIVTETVIPGYHIFIFVGILSLTTLITLINFKKSKKANSQ